jgi:hypothetical protein
MGIEKIIKGLGIIALGTSISPNSYATEPDKTIQSRFERIDDPIEALVVGPIIPIFTAFSLLEDAFSNKAYFDSIKIPENYDFERFKKAFGEKRLENVDEDVLNGLKEYAFSKEGQVYFTIYSNPDEIIKDFSAEKRKQFEDFSPSNLPEELLSTFEDFIKWDFVPDNGVYTKSDKLAIFIRDYEIRKSFKSHGLDINQYLIDIKKNSNQ